MSSKNLIIICSNTIHLATKSIDYEPSNTPNIYISNYLAEITCPDDLPRYRRPLYWIQKIGYSKSM